VTTPLGVTYDNVTRRVIEQDSTVSQQQLRFRAGVAGRYRSGFFWGN
jgi:hypothetical protein